MKRYSTGDLVIACHHVAVALDLTTTALRLKRPERLSDLIACISSPHSGETHVANMAMLFPLVEPLNQRNSAASEVKISIPAVRAVQVPFGTQELPCPLSDWVCR